MKKQAISYGWHREGNLAPSRGHYELLHIQIQE